MMLVVVIFTIYKTYYQLSSEIINKYFEYINNLINTKLYLHCDDKYAGVIMKKFDNAHHSESFLKYESTKNLNKTPNTSYDLMISCAHNNFDNVILENFVSTTAW